jgi:hypothetical protein
LNIRETRYCFSRCGNKNNDRSGTLAPTDGKKGIELQIKGHGLSILTLKQNQDSFTDDGWFKTGDVNDRSRWLYGN